MVEGARCLDATVCIKPCGELWKRTAGLITADPLILVLEQTELRADLGAEKTFAAEKEGRKIAIELKEFTAVSGVSELEKAIGQLQLYQWALDAQEPDRKLFLAVSEMAYVKYTAAH